MRLACSWVIYCSMTIYFRFVYICREVITTRAVPEVKFSLIIMPTLQKLAADRIPNVRIALAKVLLLVGRSGEYFEDSAPVESLMKKLLDDQDKDVRQLADIYYGRSF